MNISEKLIKPIAETSYLTAKNVAQYRVIVRYFYMQYEKMNYWLTQDDVFNELSKYEEFTDYTIEQCRENLDRLKEWNNILAVQDTAKVQTIEDFKNRKYRYQLSEYTVEIERMTIKLENLFIDGASLEPTLLERLRTELSKAETMAESDDLTIYAWWDMINTDFVRLNQNYQDYIRDLNSVKAEELMKTTEFIIFKDKLVDYLRTFIKSLQRNTAAIASIIRKTPQKDIDHILNAVVHHEMSIPRLDIIITKEEITDMMVGRWNSISNWFVGSEGNENEASKLFYATNEIIRKITRYATQIMEMHHLGANRKEEYRKLCDIFLNCDSIEEAHKLAALVFGVERPIHVQGDFYRTTDNIYSGVYDEPQHIIKLTPKSRAVSKASSKTAIRNYSGDKEEMIRALLEAARKEQGTLESFIKDGVLAFSDLPVIEPEIRMILLSWLSKGLESEGAIKTEFGKSFRIDKSGAKNMCRLKCSDGHFIMPCYKMIFYGAKDYERA